MSDQEIIALFWERSEDAILGGEQYRNAANISDRKCVAILRAFYYCEGRRKPR